MYLMYVDESGDTGRKAGSSSHFALSGIVVHESRWRDLIDILIAHRKTMRSVYGLPIRTEIHASEYLNKRLFNIAKHDRLAILRNTIDEIAKIEFISITNVIVEKVGKPPTYDIFSAAWSTLFQRFENTLLHGNFPGGYSRGHGLIITDATSGTKLLRMVRRMAVYNPVPNDPRYGGGYRNIPIKRIIEDPHGKDSRETYPIQMCDVTAYFLFQRFSPSSYIKRKRAQYYFDRLAPVLNTHASRKNRLGIVEL